MTSDAEEAAAREDHDLHSQTSVKQAALPEQPSSSIPLARSLARCVAQKAIRDRGEMTMVNGGGAEEGRDQRERGRERRPQSRSCDASQDSSRQ